VLSEIENRNEFSYILNHEFGLYIGRLFGAGTFLGITFFHKCEYCIEICLINNWDCSTSLHSYRKAAFTTTK